MSRFIKKQGFTLIELMVVIVIIGVLASLAIPRFTEASSKAKMGEAPRIIASFESGFLATLAEGASVKTVDEMTISIPASSNWFDYKADVDTDAGTGELTAEASKDIGKFLKGKALGTKYVGNQEKETKDFEHCVDEKEIAKKLVPTFVNDEITEGC